MTKIVKNVEKLQKKGVLGNCPRGAEKGPKMGQNTGSAKSVKKRDFLRKNVKISMKT